MAEGISVDKTPLIEKYLGNFAPRRAAARSGTALRSHHHTLLYGDGTSAVVRLPEASLYTGRSSPHEIGSLPPHPPALLSSAKSEANVPRHHLQRRRTVFRTQR